MEITGEKDFKEVRQQCNKWRKKFPMFTHDVNKLEHTIEYHIQQYSIALVHYRQTKQRRYVELAETELQNIENVVNNAEKVMLMAILSRR